MKKGNSNGKDCGRAPAVTVKRDVPGNKCMEDGPREGGCAQWFCSFCDAG